jgi:hypothetical protein
MPAAAVNAPPSIEYSPPVMDTGALPVMPVTTISLEAATVARAMSACTVKLNVSGVMSAEPDPPPPSPPPPPPPQPAASRHNNPTITQRDNCFRTPAVP